MSWPSTWQPLPPHMLAKGTLHVYLSHATGLKSADRNGLSDPYVKLSLGKHKSKSKTIKKTLNPRWDEDFEWRGTLRDRPSSAW